MRNHNHSLPYRALRYRTTAVVGVALIVVVAISGVIAEGGKSFRTKEPPMLVGVGGGNKAKAIITVGDMLSNGYRFESIPDGVAIDPRGSESLDVYVNHETSTVPFFGSDFENSQVSRLTIRKGGSGKVLDGRLIITSDDNFVRFCSNSMATKREGIDPPLFFTNEESSNAVNRTGGLWPPSAGSDSEDAGLAVAYDPDLDTFRTIPGMGYHNHENTVAIPGYQDIVILSGDDTFSRGNSQLYMYIAADRMDVWNDNGMLYAFKSDPTDPDQYEDLDPAVPISGTFILVPRDVADGTLAKSMGSNLEQDVLEDWSDANGIFEFLRVEDIAYDKNQDHIVYFADTAGSSTFPNGRIFKMVLDASDPTIVTELSVLIDGDALPAGDLDAIHNPDNIETTKLSLMIQEDPGSANQYASDDPDGTTARIWRFSFKTGQLTVVAKVDQSGDPDARQGQWESSGIWDASALTGRDGTFLVTVQAHTLLLETAVGTEIDPTTGELVQLKREAGQLLLLKIKEKDKKKK